MEFKKMKEMIKLLKDKEERIGELIDMLSDDNVDEVYYIIVKYLDNMIDELEEL